MWRKIYWSDESRFLLRFTDERARVWRQRGQDPFQNYVVAETEISGGGSLMLWDCFTHDHKLYLLVVRQTLTGQRYIDDNLQPIVYPYFRAHQAARPIFRTTMPVRIGPVLLQNLLPRKGLRNFSGPV